MAHGFKWFQFTVRWLHRFLACDGAEYHGAECVLEQSYSPHGISEEKSKAVHHIFFKGRHPVTYLFQLGISS